MLNKIPANRDVQAENCRRSLFYFLKEFWSEIIPETPVWNWHIEYLCDELQDVVMKVKHRLPKDEDVIINIPPGTTKSTICTVMLPAWCWTIDPSIRVLTASYSASLSTDHAVKSRDIIKSDKYKDYFPDVAIKKDQDNKTHYKNTKGGERYATSVTGAITGFHAHVIIVDDPLNPKGASSDAERKTGKDFMDTTLSTRKVDKRMTPTILVMQRLHEEDPTGNWLKKKSKSIKHICLPGEDSKLVKPEELRANYKDGLLDPVRLDNEALKELKTDLGSYGYAGQISQTPTPEGGGIWKNWFIPVPDDQFPQNLSQLGTDWDLAYTEKESNSASAYCKSGKLGVNMYIDDIDFKWLEFPELIHWMKKQKSPHYIEAKASGKSAKQTLRKKGIPAIEVKVDGGGDKVGRARMATPFAESGMIYCRQSLIDKLLNDEKQGLLKFPNTGTDLNDAVVQAINRLFKKTVARPKKATLI